MPPFADAPRVPVTERVSPHALDMESRGAEGVLEALAACDAEMWAEAHADDDGTRDASSHPGLIHPTVVADIARLALAVSRCVASDTPETPAAVLVVGCGTSGRLAFQCARAAELSSRHEKGGVRGRKRKRAVFRHVLAGGDAALFQSAESCEDDRERGASDFRRAVAAYEPHPLKSLVVVGVSCGLSAPYVSSFLAEAGRFGARAPEGKDALTVARFALGFNPRRDAPERGGFRELFPSFAETRAEPGPARVASETFALASENFDVSADGPSGRDARRDEDVVFVNPVLGPELVAGSSRLKGGSATKIILDAAFAVAEVMRGVHRHPEKATYTLFRRCCFALMPALLAPIGFCIAELARFRGRVVALMLALVPLAMFYLGEVLGARLLISTKNPWCGWMPVVLLTAIGAPLVWRQLRR